ncbi:hypothetical protein RMN56_23925 [Micromonospora halotolerans]|uniref:Uncharacterized protein n=1 Tax=Micromonospora halotolerans TaxID=709879 RepID=A0ABY9ZUV6_9ACTN|nr:hypothetical protein [Micromonospora halotolerans]WNM38166.1 hypothetical protein RMN56_23925 [Micromonospora halotolerans]
MSAAHRTARRRSRCMACGWNWSTYQPKSSGRAVFEVQAKVVWTTKW